MSDAPAPILVYDAKCPSCTQLARKIQFSSRAKLEIKALSDPDAIALLAHHYSKGWDRAFYLLSKEFARRGTGVVPWLLRAVGLKNFLLLAAEYLTVMRSLHKCRRQGQREAERDHGLPVGKSDDVSHTGSVAQQTPNDPDRRSFLKYAALSPLAVPAARLPRIADPVHENRGAFLVHVAEVEPNGADFSVRAWRCAECLVPDGEQRLARGNRDRPAPRVVSENRVTLLDRPLSIPAPRGFSTPTVRVDRVEKDVEGEDASGARSRGSMTSHSVLFDQGRYHLSLNMGRGRVSGATGTTEAVSMAGMIGHDVALPVVDFVVLKPDGQDDPSRHIAAYEAGVRQLGGLHSTEGRDNLSALYREIANGLAAIGPTVGASVGPLGPPAQNQLVLTQMVDMLRFVMLPPHVQPGPRRGDEVSIMGCSCSCGCCCGCCSACGCGCSLGFCFPPGVCTCCCGTNCGCGCGCGCCCGWGC